MYKNFKLTEEEKNQILEMHQSHGYKKPLIEQEQEQEQEIGGGNFVISDEVTTTSEPDMYVIKVVDKSDEKLYTVLLKRLYSGKKRVKDIFDDGGHIDDIEKIREIEKYVLSALENVDLPVRFSFNIMNGKIRKIKPIF
jgi:hypothetical protein